MGQYSPVTAIANGQTRLAVVVAMANATTWTKVSKCPGPPGPLRSSSWWCSFNNRTRAC